MSDETTKLLSIYLNDHYLGANSGVALAARIAKEHRDTPFSDELDALAEKIYDDLATLVTLMGKLGVDPKKWRGPAGIAAERVGRLKLNGHVFTRSPLSSVLEIEALQAGVAAKRSAWRTLRRLADSEGNLDAAELDSLINKSLEQTELLENVRSWAIDQAFVSTDVPGVPDR
jgi:hypothetical protein